MTTLVVKGIKGLSAATLGTTRTFARDPGQLKFALAWISSWLPGRTPLKDGAPYVTFRAMEWLEGYLTPEVSVFEYGSGGSTVYLAKRVKTVVSVEHDRRPV